MSFTTHRVPASAVRALAEAKRRGHQFFISTGRPPQFIFNLQQVESLIDGYITTNGALCYVGRDVESIVRDLVEASIRLVKSQHTARVRNRAACVVEASARQSSQLG